MRRSLKNAVFSVLPRQIEKQPDLARPTPCASKNLAVLTLARALASHFEGMTLDEMAALIRVGRRTAERMRDAVEAAFGPLERGDDGRKVRFRLAARGLGNFASAPTAEELAELENAARALAAAGNESRAATLRSLGTKIGASLREADRRRLGVDVEAQLRAEAFACQVGPRPLADPTVLARLREALLAGIMVKFMESRRAGARSSPMASCSARAPTWSPASRAARRQCSSASMRSMGSKSSTGPARRRRTSTSELTPSARSACSRRSRWRWCFASRHPPRRTPAPFSSIRPKP